MQCVELREFPFGKIASAIGDKGGTGKTTLSHMMAHGLDLFRMHAVAILTDNLRDKLSKTKRNYLPFDARSDENLAQAVARLRAVGHWTGSIDGGGNRPEMDRKLADLADLVILPFRDSHEDMRTVIRDLERFPNAYALPSQSPINSWAEGSAQRSMNSLPVNDGHRILAPVYALSSSKLLLQDLPPTSLPRWLHNAAREIALQVLELLGVDLPDTDWMAAGIQTQQRGAPALMAAPAPSILHA